LLGESTSEPSIVAKAGGMDLLDLMKEGLVRPRRVVNLKTISGLNDIRLEPDGSLHIGTLVTLAQIARAPAIRERFGALAAAADHAATPQVRNVATLGGNLLQRPRCWYFRNEHFAREHVTTAAREGENHYHGIFDTDQTPLVHASTPATALLAYDATIHVTGARGSRSIGIRDFFLAPDPTRNADVTMHSDEILTHVTLPATSARTVSRYHKQTERESYDWPICDIAVALKLSTDCLIESAAIGLGWVAPTPMRASQAETLLVGKTLNEPLAAEAARMIVSTAQPLKYNAYKVAVLEAVIQRTLLAAVK
jgi:xanthine dehydrogenase YagS FAD-binding subunit